VWPPPPAGAAQLPAAALGPARCAMLPAAACEALPWPPRPAASMKLLTILLLLLLCLLANATATPPASELEDAIRGALRGDDASPIKHVVVLYQENRGFDHVFGFARERGIKVNGLSGNESNPLSLSDPSQGRLKVQKGSPLVATMDPNHGMPAYTLKIFGNATYDETSKDGKCMNSCEATMEGFLPVEYQGEGYKHIKRNLSEAQYVMQSFDPAQLPVTMALAENFAVFERWWAAFPGPSWPNHLFSITGTSAGCTETGDYYNCS
jgi:phospholipase C